LEASKDCLIETEIEQLPFAAKIITFEQGLRFLTDHLEGDSYYRIRHPNHNLERGRVQFRLVSEMEARFDDMKEMAAARRLDK
jgi:hypothetical protein